jgi:hypothetical protein
MDVPIGTHPTLVDEGKDWIGRVLEGEVVRELAGKGDTISIGGTTKCVGEACLLWRGML